jgi:hypothetical protein
VDSARGLAPSRFRSRAAALAALAAAVLLAATACTSRGPTASGTGGGHDDQHVVAVAGWTKIASLPDYVVVANVLPGEEMFTHEQMVAEHPTEGEQVLDGPGNPLGDDVRHVEAHIYDRTTGKPLADLHPEIVLVNHTTGVRTEIPPTLMQDVAIGGLDVHYGNNVVIPANSDLSLSVRIGPEEVSLDGHLD